MSTETTAQDLAAAQSAFAARIDEQCADADGYAQHLPSEVVSTLYLATVPRFDNPGLSAFARGEAPKAVGVRYVALSDTAPGAKVLCYADTPTEAADDAIAELWAERRFA